MVTTQAMMDTVKVSGFDTGNLVAAIDALSALERDSTVCAMAMAAGCGHEDLGSATRAALDCADVAAAAHRVLSRGPSVDVAVALAILDAAIAAADRCVAECQDSTHEHCQLHVESARHASGSCHALIDSMSVKS